jgi:hypothetical protein
VLGQDARAPGGIAQRGPHVLGADLLHDLAADVAPALGDALEARGDLGVGEQLVRPRSRSAAARITARWPSVRCLTCADGGRWRAPPTTMPSEICRPFSSRNR